MIFNNPSLAAKLELYTKDDALPVITRVMHAGVEQILHLYNNMTMFDFKNLISSETKVAIN